MFYCLKCSFATGKTDPFTEITPCELIPRQFSCVKAPTDCSALSLKMSESGTGIQKAIQKTNRKIKHPEEPSGGTSAKKRKMTEDESTKLDEFLAGLFSQRPIWARYMLQIKFDNAGLGTINTCILRKLRLIAALQK